MNVGTVSQVASAGDGLEDSARRLLLDHLAVSLDPDLLESRRGVHSGPERLVGQASLILRSGTEKNLSTALSIGKCHVKGQSTNYCTFCRFSRELDPYFTNDTN